MSLLAILQKDKNKENINYEILTNNGGYKNVIKTELTTNRELTYKNICYLMKLQEYLH